MTTAAEHSTILMIDRSVTLQTISALYKELSSALEGASEVTLDIGAIGEVDLTLVQLVESARRTAAYQGKRLSLAVAADGELRTLLERGGFVAAPESRHFWLHEATQ